MRRARHVAFLVAKLYGGMRVLLLMPDAARLALALHGRKAAIRSVESYHLIFASGVDF